MYEIDDAIESVQKAQDILGETPSIRQYEDLGLKPSSSVITARWGWQEVKKQADLETLDASDRSSGEIEPKPDDINIPDDKKWCELSPHMRWYYKNQEEAKQKAKQRRKRREKENRRKVQQIKLDRGCKECGYDEHYAALDFHHKNDEIKSMNISLMLGRGYSYEKISEEIDKCNVLCANCHRVHHSEY